MTPLDAIVERHICARFAVEPAVAFRDAEEVVEQLAGHGLLILSDAPVAAH